MSKSPLERAYERFDRSQRRLADALGTSQQNVSNWMRAKRPLPAEYVLRAEAATGIARHVWRPDIYPPAEFADRTTDKQAAAAA